MVSVLRLDDLRAVVCEDPWKLDSERGDLESAFAAADVIVGGAFTTPDNTNNPLGLFCPLAHWDGDRLTVHDSSCGL